LICFKNKKNTIMKIRISFLTLCLVLMILRATSAPKIILKLDDFGAKNWATGHATVLDYLMDKKIKASVGVIANLIDYTAYDLCKPYMEAKDSTGNKLFEVWHHGLDHIDPEFGGTTYEYQKLHFETANQLVNTYMGVQMHTLGTPFNASDTATNRVVYENPNYKVFIFPTIAPPTSSGIVSLYNRVDLENGPGNPQYDYFIKSWNNYKDKYLDYMVIQGHPVSWGPSVPERLVAFKQMIDFLIAQGCEFVLPYDYYRSLTLTAPTNLAAKAISANQIDLVWSDNSTSEYNYKIEFSTDSLKWSIIATVGENINKYSVKQLPATSSNAYFRVYANCGIKSAYSNVIKVSNSFNGIITNPDTVIVFPSPRSLVVNRVGNGTASLLSTSTRVSAPVSLYEFNSSESNQTIPAAPKVSIGSDVSGSRLTISGGTAGEGQLMLSTNRKYLSLIGYDQPISTSEATCIIGNKVIGRIDNAGALELSNSFPTSASGNAKSVISTDGSNFYTSIDAFGYMTWNQTTVPITISTSKPMDLGIFGGQIYYYESVGNLSLTRDFLPTTSTAGTSTILGLSSALDSRGFVLIDSDNKTSTGFSKVGYDVLYLSNKSSGLEKYYWNSIGNNWLPVNSESQLRIDITNAGAGYVYGTNPTITIGNIWVTNTVMAVNTFFINSATNRLYMVKTEGTSGTSAPTFTSGDLTATGGTAIFTYIGSGATANAVVNGRGVLTGINVIPRNPQRIPNTTTYVIPTITISAPTSGTQATATAEYTGIYPYTGGLAAMTAELVNGKPVIYALTGDGRSSNNKLISITDNSGSPATTMTTANTIVVTLAQAGPNYAFRGVDFAPDKTSSGTTALKQTTDFNYKVFANESGIVIQSACNHSYKVSNILGQIISLGKIESNYQLIPITEKGVVIVQIDKFATKVILP